MTNQNQDQRNIPGDSVNNSTKSCLTIVIISAKDKVQICNDPFSKPPITRNWSLEITAICSDITIPAGYLISTVEGDRLRIKNFDAVISMISIFEARYVGSQY